ncbi:hypothetical protein EMIT0215P_190065 [Pseudomonas serboccidentalis]
MPLKIAAFGRSYRVNSRTHPPVGAAEGCDLLILIPIQPDNGGHSWPVIPCSACRCPRRHSKVDGRGQA